MPSIDLGKVQADEETTASIITKLDGSAGKIGSSVIPDALSGVGVPDLGVFASAFAGANNDVTISGRGFKGITITATPSVGATSGSTNYADGRLTINIGSPGGNVAGTMTASQLVALSIPSQPPSPFNLTRALAVGNDGSGNIVTGVYNSDYVAGAFIGQLYRETTTGVWYRWTGAAWDEDAGEVTLTGSQTLASKTLTDPLFAGFREAPTDLGNSGASKTLAITASTAQQMTMTAACAVAMPAIDAGRSFLFHVIAGSDPAWIPTFNSTPSVNWGGAVPTMRTTPGARNIYSFHVSPDGTGWNGALSGAGGTVENTIIDGNLNAVSGNAVFDALAEKQPLDADLTAYANAADAAARRALLGIVDPLPALRTIAFLGDSITNNNSGYVFYSPPVGICGHLSSGYGFWADSILGRKFTEVRNNYAPHGPTQPSMDFGWDGILADGIVSQTVNQISNGGNLYPGITITPLNAAIAANPDSFVCLIGTNDIAQSAATITARIDTIVTALRLTGKPVFLCEVLPRTSAADPTNTMQAKIDDINARLVAVAAARGCILVTWANLVKNVSGLAHVDYFLAETLGADAILLHPNAGGACVLGQALASYLAPYYPTTQLLPPPVDSPLWATTNAYMTTGTTVATGFSYQYAAAPGTIHTDGAGAKWQNINQTDPNSIVQGAAFASPAIAQPRLDALIASGTPIRGCARYELVSGKMGHISLHALLKNSGYVVLRAGHAGTGNDPSYLGPHPPHTGILFTERMTVPAGTSSGSGKSTLEFKSTGGGLIRVTQMGYFEDP